MTRPIKATGKPYLTVYQFEDGSKEVRTGGWPAWRNNNPGNLKAFPFSFDKGAIGKGGNNLAIFPDVQTGIDAQIHLLKLPVYQKLSLEAAIAKYAPKSDGNDPKKYTDDVVKETGVKRNTPMAELGMKNSWPLSWLCEMLKIIKLVISK